MIHGSASNQILLISQPTEQNTVHMKRKICKAQQILKKSMEELALKSYCDLKEQQTNIQVL